MSLLATADRLNTANQLKAWNDSCTSSMNSAKSTYVKSQATSVAETNTDYNKRTKTK